MENIDRLMVPLDGSETAEAALPMAELVATATGADVELVHVHGVLYGQGGDPVERDVLRSAEDYLAAKAGALAKATGAPVQETLLEGPVARAILDHLGERPAVTGLVVMTTHGRSGLSHFWLGSVAENLVRSAPWPVLLVRPAGDAETEPRLERILVALDGSSRAERALPWARALAGPLDAGIVLFQAVSDPEDRDAAARDLAGIAEEGEETFVAVEGSPVDAILEQARGRGSDLIALTTRGRGAVARSLFGSVADKILRSAETPLLVLNDTGEEA